MWKASVEAALMAARAPAPRPGGGRLSGLARTSPTRARKSAVAAMKTSAPASWGPTREIALLSAEATPALAAGALAMSALVRGATSGASPAPKSSELGRMSTR